MTHLDPGAPPPEPGTDSREQQIETLFQAGEAALRRHDLAAAKASFQAALALDGAQVRVLYKLAAVLRQLGCFDDALKATRRALGVAPAKAELHVQLGWLLKDARQLDAAASAFSTALEREPRNAGAHSGLGVVLELQGKTAEALECARIAAEMAPWNAGLLAKLGHLQASRPASRDEAAATFQAALRIDSNDEGALIGLAALYTQDKRGPDAIAMLRAATQRRPDDVSLHLRLGQVLEDHRELEEAAEVYQHAATLDPQRRQARDALRRVRGPNHILKLIEQALSVTSDTDSFDRLAKALDVPPLRLRALLDFAANPSLSGIDALANNPLERELLSGIWQMGIWQMGIVRMSAQPQTATSAGQPMHPGPVRTAPPDIDVLAEQLTPAQWSPVQWFAAFVSRQTKITRQAAVIATMRDEGLSLLEWVAHHRALGIGRIVIYANDNADGSDELLQALAEAGVIIFVRNTMDEARSLNIQRKAYAHALHLVPELWEAEWLLVVDADEFLLPAESHEYRVGPLLDALAEAYPDHPPSAICFNWMWYVSGHRYRRQPGLLLNRFPHAVARGGKKSMVRLRDTFSLAQIHFPDIGPQGFLVRSDFSVLPWVERWSKTDPVFASAQLNHYWNKSFEEFALKKARGDAIAHRDSGARRSFELFFTNNSAETPENHKPPPDAFVQRVQNELEQLTAFPGVRAAQAAIEARFPELLARFDAAGGLRAIYEDAWSRTIGRDKAAKLPSL